MYLEIAVSGDRLDLPMLADYLKWFRQMTGLLQDSVRSGRPAERQLCAGLDRSPADKAGWRISLPSWRLDGLSILACWREGLHFIQPEALCPPGMMARRRCSFHRADATPSAKPSGAGR